MFSATVNSTRKPANCVERVVPITLTPKAYAVLDYLICHRDRLVSKEELLEQVWPDTYVDDSAVKRNIMAVRRAIGDGSGAPQPIKTQRGQGYRFVAAIQIHDSQSETLTHADSDSESPGQAVSPSGDTLEFKPCMTCQHENFSHRSVLCQLRPGIGYHLRPLRRSGCAARHILPGMRIDAHGSREPSFHSARPSIIDRSRDTGWGTQTDYGAMWYGCQCPLKRDRGGTRCAA